MKPLFRSVRSVALAATACFLAACAGTGSSSPPAAGGPIEGCTEEAMVCPDGSSVGRTGPNCELAPCPASGDSPPSGSADSGASVCKNECGNGTCEEIVCQAIGCPCSETKTSCPQDCK